ncbi:MAG: right-handed parallel beta-helix repeat-containing protein [Clostridia bacterium]|nr:right-handed parallel beta-helix repeat-containing protein [Clostridia bacterium]
MEHLITNEAELKASLKSAAENDSFIISGRIALSDMVRLSGLKGLTFKGESDGAFEMLVPVGGFYEADVNGKTVWCADIPQNIALMKPYNAFSKDGKQLIRPRLPRSGFYNVSGLAPRVPGEKLICTDFYEFCFSDGEIPDMKYPETAQIRMFHWWTDELCYIDSVDREHNVVYLKNPILHCPRCENHPTKGARWYLDNVFEALGTPGEYYITPDCSKIYYVPAQGEVINGFVLMLSTSEKLLAMDDCSDISFENIVFCGSDRDKMNVIRRHSQAASDVPCAVDINDSSSISFTDCKFVNVGLSCIGIDNGSHHVDVCRCEFSMIGGTAVYIKGDNLSDKDWVTTYPNVLHGIVNRVGNNIMHDIRVVGCHIHNYGNIYRNACGITLKFAYNCEISGNEIHDGVYTGISCGWVWGYTPHATNHIKIENNHIYDIGKELLSDMGGIYTLGQQEGTVIRGNRIHDIKMYVYGGWGIYLDEGSSDITVERNICYDLFEQPFHQHYGSNNLVKNNIFAFGEGGCFKISRKEEHLSVILERNILVSMGTAIYGCTACEADEMSITDCANLVWDYSGEPFSGDMVFDAINRKFNLPSKEHIRTAEQMKAAGLFACTVIADPKFTDVDARDFTLSPDSPAISLGFEWLVNEDN